jgi:aryl-alcohol dehydrogenase-like predicted oxidoreductase
MQYRTLGKTNYNISEISLGTWQVGGKWGSPFDADNAEAILKTAIDKGINFIDTADVYSNGLSEKAVGKAVKSQTQKIYIATKCGRRFQPHTDASYTLSALRKSVEDSLLNIGVDHIDLIQLHCPPWETYYRPEVFDLFDRLKSEGKIGALGVSVEKVEQAIKAMEYENVTTIQIIFNLFRQRPSELFFELAKIKNVGIIVRVPLASGLLTGTFTADTTFGADDHRTFNRNGEAFDKGETFSGIDYQKGLEAVRVLKDHFGDTNLALLAIRWVLMYDEVSCVIPGASNPNQVLKNIKAADLQSISEADMKFIRTVYDRYVKDDVHQLW